MAKLKDGFYKLTASSIGSDLLVLLAGGGAKPISDFALFNNAYWANIPISNTSSTTTNPTFGSITVPLTGLIVGSKSTDTSPTRVLMCYDTTLTTKYMNIGNDPSAGNAGEFHYAYSANASTSNNVGLGFYSGNRLKLYYNGGGGVLVLVNYKSR